MNSCGTMLLPSLSVCIALVLFPSPSPGQELVTDHFHFSLTSAEGATGDIVAVDVSLSVDSAPNDGWYLIGITAVICYDGRDLELAAEPAFSEEHDRYFYFTYGGRLGSAAVFDPLSTKAGYELDLAPTGEAKELLRQPGATIPVCTFFFRVLAAPGSVVPIRFCDGEFCYAPPYGCMPRVNELSYITGFRSGVLARSTRHVPGTIRVLPGEPTQTELPELPPSAKVYSEAPTAETAQIHFEIPQAIARPGQRGVAVEVYVTASHEFCGYSVALEFPKELVSVSSVEGMSRQGVVIIENDLGRACFAYLGGHRRIGREGERVHLGTLRVDVSEEASGAEEISFRFAENGKYANWLRIRYAQSGVAMALPFTAEVQPISLSARALRIQARPTTLGDANLDHKVDVSDAVGLLSHLFLGGEEPVCEAACDANADGRLNLADAVAILNALFRGRGELDDTEIWCTGEL